MFLTPSFVISRYLLSISFTTQPRTEAAFLASVITGHIRCGIPSYVESSSIFGSININLHLSGVWRYRRDKIIVFIQTDLPEPVVPAINKWGIDDKSPTIGLPEILFPKAIGNFISFFLKSESLKISFKKTFSLILFGSSIPTVLLPGIVAILADSELVFLAISSDKLIIFETLTPAAGSNSLRVTTGPWLIFLILPFTPKSKRIFSKKSELCDLLFPFFSFSFFDGVSNKSKLGNLNLTLFSLLFSALINGKSSWIRFFIYSCGMYSSIISFLFV